MHVCSSTSIGVWENGIKYFPFKLQRRQAISERMLVVTGRLLEHRKCKTNLKALMKRGIIFFSSSFIHIHACFESSLTQLSTEIAISESYSTFMLKFVREKTD